MLDTHVYDYRATLLFKDRANYGGIPAVDKENVDNRMPGDENAANSQPEHSSQKPYATL